MMLDVKRQMRMRRWKAKEDEERRDRVFNLSEV